MASDPTLPDVEWTLEGQLLEASNVVLRLRADGSAEATRAVYKPLKGERPLADFPDRTLAHREVATWLVADAGGWSCVPQTRWFDGEAGPGSLQRWVGPLTPEDPECVRLLTPDEIDGEAWLPIAAFEADEGPLVLVHRDDPHLQLVAALDIVTNNADRKGSHLIETQGALYAIDNGLTFHPEEKLRTVLWGWAQDPLPEHVVGCLRRLADARDDLTRDLHAHLTGDEIDALHTRTDNLLTAGVFPDPPEDRYGLPWPPL